MNECLYVYLNLDLEREEEKEALIERMDELLLTVGMQYSGMQNMYIPTDRTNRDQAVFRAEKALRSTDWLKGILAYTLVGTLTNACPFEEIQTNQMSDPSQEKLLYYEQYYQKTKRLSHAIVVDEKKELRDGYISYLLAKKYGIQAEICEMVSGQPLRKIVKGRHVELSGGAWRKKGSRSYIWIYSLRKPVVPGDILLVNTKRGADFICVDKVDYAAGKEFCSRYKKVQKHMNIRMEEGEEPNHGK